MAAGSNRIAFGWVLAILCWLMSVLVLAVPTEDTSIGRDSDGDGVDDGCDEDPNDWFNDYDYCDDSGAMGAGGCCCLSGFLSLLIVQSGKDAKKKAATQVFYIAQTQHKLCTTLCSNKFQWSNRLQLPHPYRFLSQANPNRWKNNLLMLKHGIRKPET